VPRSDVHPAARRLRRKERKRDSAGEEPLNRRRAYRVAQEALKHGFDLWKMADNRARLALMLLGPLNIILVMLVSHRELFVDLSARERFWIMTGLVTYTGLAMTMFLLAIGTLRPERASPVILESPRGRRHAPLGIRHYEDVLGWSLEDYQRAWRLVTREQLVEEVAEQAYAVAVANSRKERSLHGLFRGLQWMTALAVLLLAVIAIGLLIEHHDQQLEEELMHPHHQRMSPTPRVS
jgi:hypothetical protein